MIKLNIELTEDQIKEIIESGHLKVELSVKSDSCSTNLSVEVWPDAKGNKWAEQLLRFAKEAGLKPSDLSGLSKFRVAKLCRSNSKIFNRLHHIQRFLYERVAEIEEVFGFKFCDVDEIDSEVLAIIDEKQPLLAPGEDRTKSAVSMKDCFYRRDLLYGYSVFTMADLKSCLPQEIGLARLRSDLGLS